MKKFMRIYSLLRGRRTRFAASSFLLRLWVFGLLFCPVRSRRARVQEDKLPHQHVLSPGDQSRRTQNNDYSL
ncbi:hypothetical protein IWZ01DRAFT_514673 [Phyllosticta capitalensis]